tara:strand:- start:1646 stop:2401 length:756 start_codon:yes stop_codon:yes gene_type:complete
MFLKKKISLIILLFFVYSCADYQIERRTKDEEKQYYSSSGFALVYEDTLYINKDINKKINNEKMETMHSFLKVNTPIKIINPTNSKFIITKISKKAKYPKIFNLVISSKISSDLDLDADNPYIEFFEIKKNKTFVAKEGQIFEEEKQVAEKAPVDEIKMDDLSEDQTVTKKVINRKTNFTLIISDFYYEDSAVNLLNELSKKTKINNIYIKKINSNKYRLLVGPFKNFSSLKNAYISLNNLGFEDLNVYKD